MTNLRNNGIKYTVAQMNFSLFALEKLVLAKMTSTRPSFSIKTSPTALSLTNWLIEMTLMRTLALFLRREW